MLRHIILLLLMLCVGVAHLVSSKSGPLVPALYVFGDSILDNGNNNQLPTVVKANYYPYGIQFHGQVPLGRFTDGKTVADFLADYLGLPYPPPYASLFGENWNGLPNSILSFHLFRESSTRGYNYASAACGILPESGSHLGRCLPMDEQIGLFEHTITSQLAPMFNEIGELSQYLSKSMFLISIGANDFIQNYFDPLYLSSKKYGHAQFAQLLVDKFSQQLKRLYDLGARKIIIMDIGPIGCVPTFARDVKFKLNNNATCDEDINDAVSHFNILLASTLQKLASNIPNSHFILGHGYNSLYDAVLNPAKYGVLDVNNPCCTTWLNGKLACVPMLDPCPDSNKHLFWDGYHPTEDVYRYWISQCIQESSFCYPMNLEELTRA
ncbi:unnamed protein product [Amaranthus hypochondriacus]